MNRSKALLLTAMLVIALFVVSLAPIAAQGETLLIWADGERAPIVTEIGAEYEAQFGVTVEVREIGFGEARQELLDFGPAGEGPDILIQPHDTVGQLVQNGAVVPIELGELADLFTPQALDLFSYDGQLWAVPYQMENVALVRNVDLVPERPATWEEVTEVARELAVDGKYAFLVQNGDAYHNHPIYSAFGGYIFGRTENGNFDPSDVGFDGEGGLAAAAWYGTMYSEALLLPNVNDDVLFSMFEEGDLGMFITGPWHSERLTAAAEAGGFEFAIDAFPGSSSALGLEAGIPFQGGQGFLISAFSEKQLLAQQFLLEFVATQEVMQALNKRFPVFAGVTTEDPNIEAFIAAGVDGIPMPNIPEMAAVWAGAGNALTLTSTGEDPVQSFLDGGEQIRAAIVLQQSDERVVGLPGSHQSEAGCAADWDPACDVTFFTTEGDGIYTLTLTLPAGDYEYKVAIDGAWAENYGLGGVGDGPNIPLSLTEETEVTFTFDDNTKTITDSVVGERVGEAVEEVVEDPMEEEVVIEFVGVPGSFQAAAGCPGDWDPACELTRMTDNGDRPYTLTVTLPAGDYEYKAALNGAWDVNYGAEGARDGANLTLSLAEESEVTFTFDSSTGVISTDHDM